ncbi:hypothetical protein TREVI0001_0372 [Treponema vincentii ATCC 35580]|uniref:Uncharacterized protein n=1 Tax=Treponema vincentii ATCC 35580 TaxID=596324 RepID=C8PTF4_9SPIR|nr:hypothetical protein TREVI0001_0372 [Treponema vincentii ATCC 35580]
MFIVELQVCKANLLLHRTTAILGGSVPLPYAFTIGTQSSIR